MLIIQLRIRQAQIYNKPLLLSIVNNMYLTLPFGGCLKILYMGKQNVALTIHVSVHITNLADGRTDYAHCCAQYIAAITIANTAYTSTDL